MKDPRCTGPFHEGHIEGACPYGYNGPESVCPVHLDIPCPSGCPYFARPLAKPVDLVNHPPHYTNGPKCPGCGRTIECIDITRWLPFNPGNAIKYLWRRYFGGKVGEDSVQPVSKARWYLDDEIARLKLEGQS